MTNSLQKAFERGILKRASAYGINLTKVAMPPLPAQGGTQGLGQGMQAGGTKMGPRMNTSMPKPIAPQPKASLVRPTPPISQVTKRPVTPPRGQPVPAAASAARPGASLPPPPTATPQQPDRSPANPTPDVDALYAKSVGKQPAQPRGIPSQPMSTNMTPPNMASMPTAAPMQAPVQLGTNRVDQASAQVTPPTAPTAGPVQPFTQLGTNRVDQASPSPVSNPVHSSNGSSEVQPQIDPAILEKLKQQAGLSGLGM